MTLNDWKSALEGVGIGCTDECRLLEVWIGGGCFLMAMDSSSNRCANFREAVMEHVWGGRHPCCVWTSGEWWVVAHVGNIENVLGDGSTQVALIGTIIGSGPTKNAALYNALLAEGARRRG